MIWPDYVPEWPLLNNPNPEQFPAPAGVIGAWGLPLINTLLLVASSFTVTLAHHAINNGERKKIVGWLMVTIALGLAFLVCQGVEYYEAYAHYGLTLSSGIFGSTFLYVNRVSRRPRYNWHDHADCYVGSGDEGSLSPRRIVSALKQRLGTGTLSTWFGCYCLFWSTSSAPNARGRSTLRR